MEQNIEDRNKPTHIRLTEFSQMLKQFNGEKIAFLANGTGASGYLQKKIMNFTKVSSLIQNLTQNGSQT